MVLFYCGFQKDTGITKQELMYNYSYSCKTGINV
jgi:hypothetical protein